MDAGTPNLIPQMIYTVYMICLTIWGILCHINSDIDYNSPRKWYSSKNFWYCFGAGAGLFLIVALRSPDVGNDTWTYLGHFARIQLIGFMDIIRTSGEIGFYVLLKLLSLITSEGQWLLVLSGFIYTFAISVFIYSNSKDYLISYISIIPFMFLAFAITGMRQTIAQAIILLGYEFVKRKKMWWYLATVSFAMLFHFSALFAIPIYYLYHIRVTSKYRFFAFLFLPLFLLLRYDLLSFFSQWFYTDYVVLPTKINTWAMALIFLLIWIVYILFSQLTFNQLNRFPIQTSATINNLESVASNSIARGAGQNVETLFFFGLLIQFCVPFNPNIYRLGLYYQIFCLILVPQITTEKKLNKQTQIIAKGAWIVVMFLMYLNFTYNAAGQNPYSFFWE